MSDAISNTSPLLYLYRIGSLDLLPKVFNEIWTPRAVLNEIREGQERGYDVPSLNDCGWLRIEDPESIPSSWLSLDLGAGELAALALALEHPERIVILDDGLARRVAEAAGLNVWGTLRVILESKSLGLVDRITPLIDQLTASGMWISAEIRNRILRLAGE